MKKYTRIVDDDVYIIPEPILEKFDELADKLADTPTTHGLYVSLQCELILNYSKYLLKNLVNPNRVKEY